MNQKLDWFQIGHAKGMALCTGGKASEVYPTQDIYTAADEAKFISGFNSAVEEFQSKGFNTFSGYGEESK